MPLSSVSICSSFADCFPPDAKALQRNQIFVHGSCDLFDLDIFGTSVRPPGHIVGKWNLPHLYWSSGREEFPYWAVTGQSGIPWQPGWKYQQQDVVFVRGQFPVLSPYKHSSTHQTCCHTPFSGWPSPSLSVVVSLFSLALSPCRHSISEHPSCPQSPRPMRRNPGVWRVSKVWPFQETRTSRTGRGSRRRRGGEITDASER